MPRPRLHTDNAARQSEYRDRKRAERIAFPSFETLARAAFETYIEAGYDRELLIQAIAQLTRREEETTRHKSVRH